MPHQNVANRPKVRRLSASGMFLEDTRMVQWLDRSMRPMSRTFQLSLNMRTSITLISSENSPQRSTPFLSESQSVASNHFLNNQKSKCRHLPAILACSRTFCDASGGTWKLRHRSKRVFRTQNFSELSFAILARMLKSYQLHVTFSDFDAVDFWVCSKSRERLKFAKNILIKARLPLLLRRALMSV